MKKMTFRRVFMSVISLVLVFAMLSSNLTVLAAPASSGAKKPTADQIAVVQKQLDAMKNQQKKAQTVDKQQVINDELYKWAKERQETEKEKATQAKFDDISEKLSIANDALPFVIDTIKDIADGGDFDTATLVGSVTDLTCGVLSCIAPWGTVASIGVQMAMTLITTLLGGDAGPSEMELMEDRLNQRLDEIADQISEVQAQLAEISNQIDASTEKIINSVTGAIENETDKNHLRDFMLSSGKDDFSYQALKNAIYGSTEDNRNGMTAYYALLLDAQLRGGSSEDIKHYYDLLYSTLVDNRATFHDYIIGDGFGKSIVETYYDVISMRPDLTAEMGKSAEMATIEFAYDLYQTEMMMDQLILICNNYQYAQMLINETESYNYGTGEVLARDIHNAQKRSNIAASLQVGIDEVRMQFAEDIIYVMGTTTSYVVEHGGQFYYLNTMEDEDGTVYAPVLQGQTVYLNTVSAMVSNQFDLDAQSFTYSGRGIMDQTGIVQITELNIEDSVTLSYVDANGSSYPVGTVTFTDAQEQPFCGGMGTEESPYLIANADQFRNIALDMTAHYCLVEDVNFFLDEMDPLGYSLNSVDSEVYEEFTGVLDGNGHTVRNLNITGYDHSGIFGKIGYEGVVKNLTLYNVNLNVEISEAKTSSSTFTGGIIAGTNNGTIKSCVVTDSSVNVDSETDNAGAERSVYLKYGGICGANNGQIEAVMVNASSVDVSSSHSFGGASTDANKNNVFVGGICGTCVGYLDYAAVDENVTLKAYTKSTLNPNTTVNPYLKAFVGGITTQEGLDVKKLDNITNIYSAVKSANLTAERELKVQSGWGKHYKNAKTEKDVLIPKVSDANLDKVKTTLQDVQNAFYAEQTHTVSITDSTGKYPVAALELNQTNMEVLVDGEAVEYFYIVNVYGFSSKNESFKDTRTVNTLVQVNAFVDGEMKLLNGKLPITIETNRVVSFNLINYEDVYLKGQAPATNVMLNHTDANGKVTTVNNAEITLKNAETATEQVGTSKLEISYQGADVSKEIEVLCDVHYSFYDYDNPEHYIFQQTVSASCQHGGYDEYLCQGCNETVRTNRTGAVDHKRVRDISYEATCAAPGLIGKIYCIYCDTVFEEQVELPRLAHNIVSNGNAANHTCTLCNKFYAHDYVVSESLVDGKVTYTYTCYSCGYVGQKQDTNIITNEERLRPTVVVSDGFALNGGDLVTVYVDLENNPGVNGANFGIRYDERLELVQWYEGAFFAGTTTEASHAVSCGYNYVWGTEAVRNNKAGNLLELVFRLPEDATSANAYEVAVVYSVVAESEGGFSLPNDICASLNIPSNHPQKFKTKDGVIRIVDRLPGDVDNNGVVNLLDALYLSNCLVNQEQYPITTEVKHYGDVNLDGTVTVNDVVKVLQSISGGYGASLMAPEYEIQLNTNGYTEYAPEALFVELYGEQNTYAALADIEAQMQQRQGYKFLGWYTRLEGGVKIENYADLKVAYDQDQKVQTLYAHWEKNTVDFDMNGATSGELDREDFLGDGEQWITLTAPKEEYTVIFTDPNKASTRQTETMSRQFLYWLGSDGEKYYAGEQLPVHKINMGQLTLTAQWGDWELNFPALEKTGYDPLYITWYTNPYLTDVLAGDVYAVIKAMENKVLYAEWTNPITYQVQYDANGGTGEMANSVHQYDSAKELSPNGFTNEYYVTIDYGCEEQGITNMQVRHIFQYWSRDGKTAVAENMVDNWTTEAGKVIAVYAVWDTKTITLPTPLARTGYSFVAWYTDAELTKLAGFNGQPGMTMDVTGECTLYAKWQAKDYNVVYELNTQGSNNATIGNADQCHSAPYWLDSSSEDKITYEVAGTYLDVPANAHYGFTGWYTAPVGGTMIADSTGKVIVADYVTANDTQLYAHWTPSYSGTYIYDEATLKAMGKEGTYHIVKDITLTTNWVPLDYFKGTLDGHGHTITGLNIQYTSDSSNHGEEVDCYGMVRTLVGTIQNVNFDKLTVNITKYRDGMENNRVGGVVGNMIGGSNLINVHVNNSSIYIDHYREVSSSGSYVNTFVGGLVGSMTGGKIENCSINGNSSVWGKAGKATSKADAQCYAGGIVGYMQGGEVVGCAREATVEVSSRSRVDGKNSASRSAAGGIVGVRDGGTIRSCTSSSSNVSGVWDNAGSYSKDYSWKYSGDIVGKGTLG